MPSATRMWIKFWGLLVLVPVLTLFGFARPSWAQSSVSTEVVITALRSSHECNAMIDMARTKRSERVVCIPPRLTDAERNKTIDLFRSVPDQVSSNERRAILGAFVLQ